MIGKLTAAGLVLAILFWFGDAAVDSLAFGEGTFATQVLSPDRHGGFMRVVVVSLLLGVSAFGQLLISKRTRAERVLQESDFRMHTMLGNAPVVLFATDRDGIITFSDGKGLEAAGLTSAGLMGHSVFELFRDTPVLTDNLRRALEGEAFTTDVDFGGATFEVHYGPVCDADGWITGVIGVAADITERVRAETALRESELRMRTILGNAPVVLFSTDREGVITFSEGKGLEPAGVNAADLVGRSAFELFRNTPAVSESIHRALAGESFTTSAEIGDRIFEMHYGPARGEGGEVTGVIGVASDITERRRAEDILQRTLEAEQKRAQKDSLTGALNHGAIGEVLAERCSSLTKEPFAVLMVDLDGMKTTNDTYGHQTGDEVLISLFETLSRDGAIVGRYGGDEFLVALPGADREAAKRYRSNVLMVLRELQLTDATSGETVCVEASLGIALYPDESEGARDLVRLADGEMYASRRRRRGDAVDRRAAA